MPSLHRRIVLARGRRSSLVVAGSRVRHQADIDATIVGATSGSLVRLHRLVFAEADYVDLVRGYVVFRSEVLNHGVRTPLAQIVVIIRRANRIRSAFRAR